MTDEPRYHVSLRTILNRMGLLWDDNQELDRVLAEGDELELHLYGGSGWYKIKRANGGGEEMPHFSYHPNIVCEGGDDSGEPFVCEWCGSVVW